MSRRIVLQLLASIFVVWLILLQLSQWFSDKSSFHIATNDYVDKSPRYVRNSRKIWGFTCQRKQCKRVLLRENVNPEALSLHTCRLFCGDNIGTLWPVPTGIVQFDKEAVAIDIKKLQFTSKNGKLTHILKHRLFKQIYAKNRRLDLLSDDGLKFEVEIKIDADDESE